MDCRRSRFIGSFLARCVPAVKVMGDVVALAALGEARHHGNRMRYTVTALAGRHCFMFVFVTGYTGNSFVFCLRLAVQLRCLFVAGSAHLVGCVGSIGYSSRHVSLMTTLAVGSTHVGTVWLMALGTERNLAMDVMAETAGKLGVLAWHLLQLDNLLTMAGETLICNVVGQLDDFWRMWIVVAAQTAGKFKMRFVAVALAALRHIVLHCRAMAGMAVLARYAGFVRTAICGNISRRIRVTLNTIAAAQYRFRRIRGNGTQYRHTHQRNRHTKGLHKFRQAFHYNPSYLVEYKPIHRIGFQMQKI